MPLVVIAGLPCSGKTTRSEQLADLFRREKREVHVIQDDYSALGCRNGIYSSSQVEKMARGSLKSRVERALTSDNVVILDSLNYIKGFRYELYCTSKHLDSTHCIVYCGTPVETAREWNEGRSREQDHYSSDVFDALAMRFETPDSRNRWDSPLFVLYPTDELPCSELVDAVLHRKAPPPNQSTQSQPLSSANFLHELDRQTQSIVSHVLALQHQGLVGGSLAVPGTEEKLCLHRQVPMAELRRIRRQFISYTKLHPVDNIELIPTLFVQYLKNTV